MNSKGLVVSILIVLLIGLFWFGARPFGLDLGRSGIPVAEYEGTVNAPDFPEGLPWLNTGRPLRLADLRGKVVLLDFWTFCCINCMHIIPELKRLEEKYPNELVVVGVHSAKFTSERQTDNIRQAVLRYEVTHPVVNDRNMELWDQYGVHAWPTLVLINPAGKIVGTLSGEGVYEPFDRLIGELARKFDAKGLLNRKPLELTPERAHAPQTLLSFPGKVLADAATRQLFIADSNHNRIVVASLEDFAVKETLGSGEPGLRDGAFDEAQFHHPQGMAFDGKVLYVADTENHAIRRADFETRTVSTLAGTGRQATQFKLGGPGKTTALNSPWDLALHGGALYIAMAGSHQLWRLNLAGDNVAPHAGSGREARVDGSLEAAALAQPSGIASDGAKLYFADSEDSSIRVADLDPRGRVETLVGGDLFDFGDRDGRGLAVRLQHPLGVAYAGGLLYVADTYNNKIKRVSPKDRTCETFLGTGKEGMSDAAPVTFDEPGGLSIADGKLYVADTNNHLIRVADLSTRQVRTLQLKQMEKLRPAAASAEFKGLVVELPEQTVGPGEAALTVDLALPGGYKLNAEAPNELKLTTSDKKIVALDGATVKTLENPKYPVTVSVAASDGKAAITADFILYYCEAEKESLCYFKNVRVRLPVTVEKGNAAKKLTLTYGLTVR